MPPEGPAAPKERVNIVYRSATGDASSDVELPLKLLVIGDFTRRADDTPLEDIRPINVDKDTFDDVLRAQGLSLSLDVPNRLAAPGSADPPDADPPHGDARLAVHLSFERLDDFAPDALVRQVPELQRLLAVREALKALKGPLGNIPEFRRRLQALVGDAAVRAQLLRELGLDDTHESEQP